MDSINSIEKNSARKHIFFDKGVFWESFKQQKIPGILITAIYLVEAILLFVDVLIGDNKVIIDGMFYTGNSGSYSYYSADPSSLHPIISIAFFIAAPVLVLVAFNFLTKRNASDLWHSLPHKRLTVFISVFLSVVAWLTIIIIGTSVVSMIMGLIFADYIPSYLFEWLIYVLTYLIQSLLMAACFTLAATLTGTLGNSIIIGLLIAFGPRVFLSTINSAIMGSLPILSNTGSLSFLDGGYNLLGGNDLSNFFEDAFRSSINSVSSASVYISVIYSFVLAVVYIVVACVLFKKRKSESAGQSSLNRKLHAVFRITLCMVICVIILTSLFGSVKNGYGTVDFSYVIWFTVAAVVYFAYELITMRKFKSLIKALPGLGIVVLLNVAIYGFMVGVRSYELSYNPTEEEIQSVSVQINEANYKAIIDVNSFFNETVYANDSNYSYIYSYAAKNVFLENKEVKQIVAKALKENNDKLKISKNEYNNFFLSGNSSYNNDVDNKYKQVAINIDTGISTKSRNIYIRNADLNKITEIYFSNEEFQNAVLTLPKKFNKEASYISMSTNYLINNLIMNDEFNDIYKKYREEISACSFDSLTKSAAYGRKIFSMSVNVDNYTLTYPLCSELTPQSYEMAIEAMYKQYAKNQEKLLEQLSSKDRNDNIQITFIDEKQNYQADFNSSETVAYEQAKKFILDHKVDGAPKVGEKFVHITCNITNGNYSNAETLTAIINLGDADIYNLIQYYS